MVTDTACPLQTHTHTDRAAGLARSVIRHAVLGHVLRTLGSQSPIGPFFVMFHLVGNSRLGGSVVVGMPAQCKTSFVSVSYLTTDH